MLFSKKPKDNQQNSDQPLGRRRPIGVGLANGRQMDVQPARPRRGGQAANQPRERVPGRNPDFRTPAANQNKTFSYYANRSQSELSLGRESLQSKPPLRRLPNRIQKLRSHLGWVIVGILAIGVVVYEMQLSTVPKITALTNSSDAPFLQETAVYQQAASKLFANSAANRNKLTINTTQIATDLQKTFPELDDVSVSLPALGSQATIYIRPADPALVLTAQNGSFVLDSNGRALSQAGSQSSSLNLASVTDQSGIAVTLGKQALPKSETLFIHSVMQQLKDKHIGVQSMVLPAATSELDVYIKGQPYFVKFNIHDNNQDAARVQSGTFIALKAQLEGQHITPSQYVDVRIEGRAYYK